MCIVLSYFVFYGLLSEINLDEWMKSTRILETSVGVRAGEGQRPSDRLPLLNARPAVNFRIAEHHASALWPVPNYTAW